MDSRQSALNQWLASLDCLTEYSLTVLAGDASFRRYFRVQTAAASFIAMDAPPERENNCQPFVAIANSLRQQGLQTPQIIASDITQGFLLLSDFGDRLYLHELSDSNAETLYSVALTALATLQNCRITYWDIPLFTADFMYQELILWQKWFLETHLALTIDTQTEKMLQEFFLFLATTAANQPQVLMHRDFHSANLMVLPNADVGILDFQDAFIGPVTYDVVSLLRDCYIAWPDTQITKLALRYKQKLPALTTVSDHEFLRWFDLMGLQRHLKALLTFSRKWHRDQNANYLQHIPRTLNYIKNVASQYRECQAFNEFLACNKDFLCVP
jgi:aminoglycoside/choline kinase family phosphotransferase